MSDRDIEEVISILFENLSTMSDGYDVADEAYTKMLAAIEEAVWAGLGGDA